MKVFSLKKIFYLQVDWCVIVYDISVYFWVGTVYNFADVALGAQSVHCLCDFKW